MNTFKRLQKNEKNLYYKLLNYTKQMSRSNWFFPIVGLFALLWFMFRVIPKPSRAAYPCQQAAFPVASAFVLWLTGGLFSIAMFGKAKQMLKNRRWILGLFLMFLSLSLYFFTITTQPQSRAYASVLGIHGFTPSDAANSPTGTAKGIYPGRVVWVHNPNATSWGGTGSWWKDEFTNQTEVNVMVSNTLQWLSGTSTDVAAWEAIFKYYNQNHSKGTVGYQSGEKIAIKLNMNALQSHKVTWKPGETDTTKRSFLAPQFVLAVLRQLVNKAGVPAANIVMYDAVRYIPDCIYNKCKTEFPDVRFADWAGGDGREQVQKDVNSTIKWSSAMTIEYDVTGSKSTSIAYLPTCVTEADYFINLSNFKGHDLAGVTLCAKNMFGSILADRHPSVVGSSRSSTPKGVGLHPYVAVHNYNQGGTWGNWTKRDMGVYNPLVDLMGHKHLGGKTLLYMIDGLYAMPSQGDSLVNTNYKWQMAPFSGDWTSSLFASLDPVALESVCLDFLRTESTMIYVTGNVDNYLHEASLAHNPPSGVFYDPERDGSRLSSLGVHEHWNNATDKKYTRNLATGSGIELISANPLTEISNIAFNQSVSLFPNPFSNVLNISLSNDISNKKIRIFNLSGRLLYESEFAPQYLSIDTRNWKSGSYFIDISSGKHRATKLIVKE